MSTKIELDAGMRAKSKARTSEISMKEARVNFAREHEAHFADFSRPALCSNVRCSQKLDSWACLMRVALFM